jgi:hypothetical protein
VVVRFRRIYVPEKVPEKISEDYTIFLRILGPFSSEKFVGL